MKLYKRAASILLVIAIFFSFMPALGGQFAYAGGDLDLDGIITGVDSGNTVTVGKTLSVTMSALDAAYGDFSTLYSKGKVGACWNVGGTDTEAVFKDGKTTYTVKAADKGKALRFETYTKDDNTHYNNSTSPYTVISVPATKDYIDCELDSTGKLTVWGELVSGKTFSELYYEGQKGGSYVTWLSGKTFTYTIDTSDPERFDFGFHALYAKLSDGTKLYYEKMPPVYIYDKPQTIKVNADFFCTGYNYICFRPWFTLPTYTFNGTDIYDGIYVQLYDGKEWGDVYGPFKSYSMLKTKYFKGNSKSGGVKIKANKTYKVRTFYGKSGVANSSAPMVGPFSNVVSIKTGKSTKPSIKSITAKAIRTRKATLIQHAHWDASGKWHPYKKSYTWETKYKVTVKLKKKPGTTGIYIGNKKCKGNKTKYTATFEDNGKLKGKKIKVSICTYNDSKIGAYGPVVTKKVKMK